MAELCRVALRTDSRRLRRVDLTITAGPDASQGFHRLVEGFRRLRSSAWWKRHVSGGIYVIEATRSGDKWHVHLHAIVQSDFLPQRELSSRWKAATGDIIVYIQLMRDTSHAVSYLTKYLSKTAVVGDFRPELARALKSSRLFSPFGTWHAIKIKIPRRECVCPKCGANDWVHDRCFDMRERWTRQAFG